MRVLLSILAASALLLLSHIDLGNAARDPAGAEQAPMELLVFEHRDCHYCPAFRRDLLQSYAQTANAAARLRFIDIEQSDTSALALKGRVEVLPTSVLMKDGKEVDRIAGYWGRDNFFKMLAYIMAKAE